MVGTIENEFVNLGWDLNEILKPGTPLQGRQKCEWLQKFIRRELTPTLNHGPIIQDPRPWTLKTQDSEPSD